MSLRDLMKRDLADFMNDTQGAGTQLLLEAPNGETATVMGQATKHHLVFNSEGRAVNSRNSHISFMESAVIGNNANYPVRNTAKKVNLTGHKVSWTDSTGESQTYLISEWFPDETLGIIVCILEAYKE